MNHFPVIALFVVLATACTVGEVGYEPDSMETRDSMAGSPGTPTDVNPPALITGGTPPETDTGGAQASPDSSSGTGGMAGEPQVVEASGGILGEPGPETGGTVATGGVSATGGALATGGGLATGGALVEEPEPECVPDPMCDSFCGVVDDGCGVEFDCGACAPTTSESTHGNVCGEQSTCIAKQLGTPDHREPSYDHQCGSKFGADFGEAWYGFGSGTACQTLTGSILCCGPAPECHFDYDVGGCAVKVFNCEVPQDGCERVVVDGRERNEWCCPE